LVWIEYSDARTRCAIAVATCSSATVIAPRFHSSPIQYIAGVMTRTCTSATDEHSRYASCASASACRPSAASNASPNRRRAAIHRSSSARGEERPGGLLMGTTRRRAVDAGWCTSSARRSVIALGSPIAGSDSRPVEVTRLRVECHERRLSRSTPLTVKRVSGLIETAYPRIGLTPAEGPPRPFCNSIRGPALQQIGDVPKVCTARCTRYGGRQPRTGSRPDSDRELTSCVPGVIGAGASKSPSSDGAQTACPLLWAAVQTRPDTPRP
jgi:hypothetical protein